MEWILESCVAFGFIDISTMKCLCTNVLWNILHEDFWQGVPFQISSLILKPVLHHKTLQQKHGHCFFITDDMTPKYDHLCSIICSTAVVFFFFLQNNCAFLDSKENILSFIHLKMFSIDLRGWHLFNPYFLTQCGCPSLNMVACKVVLASLQSDVFSDFFQISKHLVLNIAPKLTIYYPRTLAWAKALKSAYEYICYCLSFLLLSLFFFCL